MIPPPSWTPEELQRDLESATEFFRKARLEEPLEAYLEAFDEYLGVVENLLETTVDLAQMDGNALEILCDRNLLQAFRYLPGPPISEDDLKTVSQAALTPKRLRHEPEMVERIVDVIRTQLDRRRFVWVAENREPTESERNAAILASAALMATQRLSTTRRTLGKSMQEEKLAEALADYGLRQVPTRHVRTLNEAPGPGEFCRESTFGSRKADFIVGLYDRRVMAIECKVSNSATNSVKRLNNDAAAKAEVWRKEFGDRQTVPTAVLSGVYKVHNLVDAQRHGLALIWSHDLDALTAWIERTRSDTE